MFKIGMVGGAGIYHARSFSEMFNGYDRKLAAKNNFPLYSARIKNARVTHLWDEKWKDALLLAKICGIGNVVKKKEDIIGKVDGVIIADDCTMKHQRRAIPFLKAGIPTFIDKPLSPDIKEAESIIELAKKYKAPMMSASALRYAKETEKVREGKDEIGDILTGFAICREWQGGLVFYGIHAFELLYSIIGPGIKSVRSVGKKKEDIVIIRYKNGRDFVLAAYEEIAPLFQLNLYGTKGYRLIVAKDADHFYSEMLRHFVTMVETRKVPIPLEETLEIIKALVLGEKSRKNGKEIYL